MNPFELNEDDERLMAGFMSQVAALGVPMPLRDPKLLWWKAQLVRRWDAERRAQTPLDVIERIEVVAGLVAAAALLVWALPNVGRVLAGPLFGFLG